MIIAGSSDRWSWSEDINPAIAFCVQVLRHDGLQVPPFDRHPNGDGTLRALGLRPPSWREWLDALVEQLANLDEQVRSLDWRAHRRAIANIGRPLARPGIFCPGGRELRARLDELWVDYEPVADAWKRAMTDRPRHALLSPAEERRLWRGLEPFHARLPTLRVYIVDYPVPVVMAVPPTTCLVARDAADKDGSSYARAVLAAAGELAAEPPPTGAQPSPRATDGVDSAGASPQSEDE
jgi:hypothetical protein